MRSHDRASAASLCCGLCWWKWWGWGLIPFTYFCAQVERQPKKERKTTEWERLEISSRKLEIPMEHIMQRWAQ